MASTTKPKRPEGHARGQAREILQREAAAKDLQEKQRRIEIIKTSVDKQFSRFNGTLTIAIVWIVVLASIFLVLGWYSAEIFDWLSDALGFNPAKN